MNYSHLIFDLDGTLVDSLSDIALSINLLRQELSLPELARDRVAGATGDGAALLVRRCLPEDFDAEMLVERFLEIYSQHLLGKTAPYPGIRDLLEGLEGRRMAVVTNKPLPQAVAILQGAGLMRFFPVVVGGECAGAKKPDASPLRLALERLPGPFTRGLMIGDHHTDLAAGEAAGLDTCFCSWGMGNTAGLEPTCRVDTPLDLKRLLKKIV